MQHEGFACQRTAYVVFFKRNIQTCSETEFDKDCQMGLHIHAIAELPSTAERGYYMYLLDYGWNEPISRFLTDNFTKLSEFAS